MHSVPDAFDKETSSWGPLFLVAALFIGTQVFSYWGLESVFYSVIVLGGVFYVFRHAGEGIWVTFLLLALTCLLYPITVSVLGEPGAGDFRPYSFAIVSMAGAMVFSMWTRRRVQPFELKRKPALVKWAVALVGVFCLATIYGDLSPLSAGAVYVLQQSSNWVSFFLFLWIGYKLELSSAEVQSAVHRFRWTAIIYSILFLAKFIYLDYYADLTAATEFANAQRIALVFVGSSLAVIFASRLAPEGGSPTKADWLYAVILVPAVVLSGSRAVVGAAMLTLVVFASTWRRRSLLRLTLLVLAAGLVAGLILRSRIGVLQEYVVTRFLITPDLDPSFAGRVAEMQAVFEALQRNPILGNGTLASYSFFDPLFGWRESSFVDNGVGYLLLKTGLLGTTIFVVLVLSYVKLLRRLRKFLARDALIPLVVFVFYVSFMPFGPSFFEPRYSWLVGILCGYGLYLNKIYTEKTTSIGYGDGSQWKLKLS